MPCHREVCRHSKGREKEEKSFGPSLPLPCHVFCPNQSSLFPFPFFSPTSVVWEQEEGRGTKWGQHWPNGNLLMDKMGSSGRKRKGTEKHDIWMQGLFTWFYLPSPVANIPGHDEDWGRGPPGGQHVRVGHPLLGRRVKVVQVRHLRAVVRVTCKKNINVNKSLTLSWNHNIRKATF